eukprot:364481-Chlamydomonas_euryale.AAC.18
MLRQEVGQHLYITSSQCVSVMDCFEAPPHRVEVFVIFYSFIVDRENLACIVYAMKPLEQVGRGEWMFHTPCVLEWEQSDNCSHSEMLHTLDEQLHTTMAP